MTAFQTTDSLAPDVVQQSNAANPSGPTVVCTIIAKNYLSAARVLMESVKRQHVDAILVMLLVDEVNSSFDPHGEPFDVLLASDLGIPRWKHFSMKYDVMELSTAVKPYFLEQLFLRYNAQNVIYFDPDIVVYARLDSLLEFLNHYMLVLTPHITDSLRDSHHPSDLEFLRVGTFNLGFVAVSRTGEWRNFLRWWQEKLYTDCSRDVDRGLFVDQHWMDLAPSLYDGVAIARNTGYNVAYWNFKTRMLTGDPKNGLCVDDQPLVFFHFSGFAYDDPEIVSRHQDRYIMSDLPAPFRACFDDYRERLRGHGYEQTRRLPYAYGTFPDGVPIADMLRACLRRHDPRGERWPDPYNVTAPGNFRTWAVSPRGGKRRVLSPYAYDLYYHRLDLQEAFPGVAAGDERGYVDWFIRSPEHDPSPSFRSVYIDPVRAAVNLEAAKAPYVPLTWRAARAFRFYARFPVSVWPYMPARMRQIPVTLPHGPEVASKIAGRVQRSATRRVLRNPWLLRVALSAREFIRYPAWSAGGVNHPQSPLQRTAHSLNRQGGAMVRSAGANVIGYLASETGVGEAARNVLRCLDEVGYPVSVHTIHAHDLSRKHDSLASRFPTGTEHDVNIFSVNADQTFPVRDILGANVYHGRYNIGYWFWEMPTFPTRWLPCLEVYDEIWTSSAYVQATISRVAMKPVVRLPVAIDVALPPATRRADFGLPDDSFLVLCVFDALSIPERKNPWAAIDAFVCAFSKAERNGRARLVMKVTNLDQVPEVERWLRERMAEVNGILVDRYFDRLELNALRNHCDAYLSLHRAEGFGLNIAEAMFLGKPVVVTAYSGNMDFTTPDNSYLVPYKLVKLGRDYPPYDADNDWADPDTAVAAAHLRAIFEHPDAAARVGQTAALDMRRHNSPRAVGEAMVARLNRIEETRS
jgi:glycosyltransferase involved in cell wall biosynthesis